MSEEEGPVGPFGTFMSLDGRQSISGFYRIRTEMESELGSGKGMA